MIADLKPYPEYKDSGLPWLGRVPKHWETMRLKRILRPIDYRSSTGAETLLSLRRDHGVVVYAEHFSRPPQGATTVGFKQVSAGQLVVNRLQANNGLVFHSRLDGVVSPDYSVFEARAPFSMEYAGELLRTAIYRTHFRRESTGLGTGSAGFLRLYDNSFLETIIAAPSFIEQAAVVRFLSWANGRLDRAIRAKRNVIALLTEQKLAIIHRAVTRGLDPSVRLKPSGIPWIGDIPQHWELWRIGRFAVVGNGSTPSRGNLGYWKHGRYPWLNSSQVNRGFVDSSDQFVTEAALRECHLPKVPAGSVLVASTGQGKTRGSSAVLGIEATINQHIAYIKPRMAVATPVFIQLVLTAAYRRLRALSEDSGSTKGAITCEDLKRFKMALPPSQEQETVVAHVQAATRALDATMSRLIREIELLREYRTRLVADVVTGKLDVRQAAAQLPEDSSDEAATAVGDEDGSDDADDLGDEVASADEQAIG